MCLFEAMKQQECGVEGGGGRLWDLGWEQIPGLVA